MTQRLDDILNTQAALWRGASSYRRPTAVLDTGFPVLNQQLHLGGWPQGGSSEFYLPEVGSGFGEMRLLFPALGTLSQGEEQGYLLWIAPPFIPFAPALLQQHIDIQRLIVVRSDCLKDSLWAAEQALLSGACIAVFTWTDTAFIGVRELRRLQLAAQQSNSWHVVFRHHRCLRWSSPSPLRIRLQNDNLSRVQLDILKQPGGWGGQQCTVSVDPHYEKWQRLPVELLPHYTDESLPVMKNGSQQSTSSVASGVLAQSKSAHSKSTQSKSTQCLRSDKDIPAGLSTIHSR